MGSILDDYIKGKFTKYSDRQIKKNKTGRSYVNQLSQYRADIAIKLCPRCKRTREQAIHNNFYNSESYHPRCLHHGGFCVP